MVGGSLHYYVHKYTTYVIKIQFSKLTKPTFSDGGLNSDAKRLKEDSDSSSISSGTSSPSSSGSESDIESGEDSDFNPFAAGSDSDDGKVISYI